MNSTLLPVQALHELRESYDMRSVSESAVFPDLLVPEMRPALTKLAEETRALALLLLQCLSLALGRDRRHLETLHSRVLGRDNSTKIRDVCGIKSHPN